MFEISKSGLRCLKKLAKKHGPHISAHRLVLHISADGVYLCSAREQEAYLRLSSIKNNSDLSSGDYVVDAGLCNLLERNVESVSLEKRNGQLYLVCLAQVRIFEQSDEDCILLESYRDPGALGKHFSDIRKDQGVTISSAVFKSLASSARLIPKQYQRSIILSLNKGFLTLKNGDGDNEATLTCQIEPSASGDAWASAFSASDVGVSASLLAKQSSQLEIKLFGDKLVLVAGDLTLCLQYSRREIPTLCSTAYDGIKNLDQEAFLKAEVSKSKLVDFIEQPSVDGSVTAPLHQMLEPQFLELFDFEAVCIRKEQTKAISEILKRKGRFQIFLASSPRDGECRLIIRGSEYERTQELYRLVIQKLF